MAFKGFYSWGKNVVGEWTGPKRGWSSVKFEILDERKKQQNDRCEIVTQMKSRKNTI